MKSIALSNKHRSGSTLIISLVTSALLALVLSSYLMLIANRNHSTMRAMAWNTAIPVLEAGIEEALTLLNRDRNNPTPNNWIADPANGQTVSKTRVLPDGSRFQVTISNITSAGPVIFSAGYVRSPLAHDGEEISRLVEVTTTNPPSPYLFAIAANGAITLGGNAMVDGYDPALGGYNVSTNRSASGNVGTNSKDQNAINVGSAHLYGKAVTGPGGTVAVSGGSVGDFNQTTGIEGDGWTDDNMNVQFPSNSPPAGPMLSPTPVSGNGSNITLLDVDGVYTEPSFVSNNAKRPMIVTANVVLYVPGDFNVSGTGGNAGYVLIKPGASLKLYVGGATSISGGGVVNGTGSPTGFSYFGLSSNTTLNYSGTADFVGTINAPLANFNISGGASVYGAIICNTFTGGGGSSVHYNQALQARALFLMSSWREL